jgi:pantoate--beta-alanine ligase
MVEDLAMPVRIVGVDTRREPDGLAMSSRNAYLTPEERATAPVLYRVLSGVAEKLSAGSSDYAGLQAQTVAELDDHGFKVDYVSIRRAGDLREPSSDEGELVVLAAAYLGRARLIDNIEISR